MYDVTIVGGGPAGLQAALTLGRMHRRVLLLDSGSYRNDPTDAMHNFITNDGLPPAELRARARAELTAYATVEVRDAAASVVEQTDEGFAVDGERTRLLLLATGVRDTLPDKPGLAAIFGTAAAHCPFCHGHEYSGRPIAVLGSHPHVARMVEMVRPIASEVVVLADGGEVDVMDATVRREEVTGFCRSSLGARVSFAEGPDLEVGGVLVATTFEQSAPFAGELGLKLLDSGCIEVDAMGRTSLPGVFAAGDLAHSSALPMPMSSVLAAAAAGQLAAAACVAALVEEAGHGRHETPGA